MRHCKTITVCFLSTILLGTVFAWPAPSSVAAEPKVIQLWNGRAPIGDGKFEKSDARITVHHPAKANGAAVVICPGGGYGVLVKGPEGHGIAKLKNKLVAYPAIVEFLDQHLA